MSIEPPARATRPYQSPRRAQMAADTRAAILAAAVLLFLEQGYARVTVGDIARAASVAVPTVYASTGGKSAILATIVGEAIRDPIVDATLSAIRKCQDPHDVIRVTAHGVRTDNERHHDLIQVTVAAATADEAAATTLTRSDRLYRRALAHTTRRLQELQSLKPGLTPPRATDILWFYFGHHSWHVLTSQQRWSWDDTEHWLSDQAATALLDPSR